MILEHLYWVTVHVAIEIKDEGSGIPKEMLDRLGEPFYSNKKRGTGIRSNGKL